MIKKLISSILLLFILNVQSQDASKLRKIINFSSESKLIEYVEEAKSRGLTLSQIKTIAKTQGANSDEIELVEKLWSESLDGDELLKEGDVEEIKSSLGKR